MCGVQCLKNYTINTLRKHRRNSHVQVGCGLMRENPDQTDNAPSSARRSAHAPVAKPRRRRASVEGGKLDVADGRSVQGAPVQHGRAGRARVRTPQEAPASGARANAVDRLRQARADRNGITGRLHASQTPRQHKQNFIARAANQWFDRVVGAMKGEGLSAAEAAFCFSLWALSSSSYGGRVFSKS